MSQIDKHYIQILLDHAERLGFSSESLLNRIGLDRDTLNQQDTLDTHYSSELIRRLWQDTNDEQLLLCTTPLKRGLFYIATKLALHANCLQTGLREAFHLYDIATDVIQLTLDIKGERAIISINIDTADNDPEHFLIDFSLSSWHRFSCWLIGSQIPLLNTTLPFAKPQQNKRYEHIFKSPIQYDQATASIEFDVKYLAYSSIRSRTELRDFIRHSPADILETAVEDHSYEAQIKAIILKVSSPELTFPPFEYLANEIITSPQTLRRRLKAEGTSYQNIKDILRRDRCIEKLTQGKQSVADIAASVGFTEPAALTRAFKRWTGLTPQDYRLNHSK